MCLGEGQRERESAVSTEPDVGLYLTNHKIMTYDDMKFDA